MIDDLKFVQGAVARKDFVPELTHFLIKDNHIRGFNGRLALCSPIAIELEASPNAAQFVSAITACKDTVELHLTATGRLVVRSGKYKAFVDCLKQEYPHIEPEGDPVDLEGVDMLSALRELYPFISEDASRPWSQGILFSGKSAFATNNIVVVERWLDRAFPVSVNVPRYAVREILRFKQNPVKMQMGKNSTTFFFDGGRWMRCQLIEGKWPDLDRVLNAPGNLVPIPEELPIGLEALAPSVDPLGRIYFLDGAMSTVNGEDTGAVYQIPGLPVGAIFNVEHLRSVLAIATSIALDQYPAPCPFQGDNMRGAIVGVRI